MVSPKTDQHDNPLDTRYFIGTASLSSKNYIGVKQKSTHKAKQRILGELEGGISKFSDAGVLLSSTAKCKEIAISGFKAMGY